MHVAPSFGNHSLSSLLFYMMEIYVNTMRMADDMSYFKNDPEVFSKPNLSLKAKNNNEEEPNGIIENNNR